MLTSSLLWAFYGYFPVPLALVLAGSFAMIAGLTLTFLRRGRPH